jgi:hypothetical protein
MRRALTRRAPEEQPDREHHDADGHDADDDEDRHVYHRIGGRKRCPND